MEAICFSEVEFSSPSFHTFTILYQVDARRFYLGESKVLQYFSNVKPNLPPPDALLGHLAFVLDGILISGRFEAERPPALVGPCSGGRAAVMTPMYPLYSTCSSYILAYVPGFRFRSGILLDSLDPHCT